MWSNGLHFRSAEHFLVFPLYLLVVLFLQQANLAIMDILLVVVPTPVLFAWTNLIRWDF